MKTYVFVVAALLALTICSTVPAQPDPRRVPDPTISPGAGAIMTSETTAEMLAEEVEIMRRLLDRALEGQQTALGVRKDVIHNLAFSPTGNSLWIDYGFPGTNFYQPYGNPPFGTSSMTMPGMSPGGMATVKNPYSNLSGSSSLGTTLYPSYSYGNSITGPFLGTINTTSSVHAIPAHAAPELRGSQGVYLKGYGVVYTATLALPTLPPVADPKKPAPKPLTDWERTRLELRGEKIEPKKPAAPHESLADTVLKVLADNGKNFSQLADTEQITVSLTLPRVHSCMQCHLDPIEKSKGNSGSSSGSSSSGTSSSNKGEPATKDLVDKVNALKKDAQKSVLLGDLHLKQGKNEQAAASLEEALKLYLDAAETLRRSGLDLKGTPDTDAQLEQDLVVTVAKLIQVYTALGKKDEVQKMLKTLEIHAPRAKTAETANKPPEASAKVELPAKLLISTPKKLLDLAGSNKITFEEFRKNATIEYQPAKTIEKKPAKPASGDK